MSHDTLSSLLERLQAPILSPKLKAATVRYRFTLDSSEQWDICTRAASRWTRPGLSRLSGGVYLGRVRRRTIGAAQPAHVLHAR